MSEGEKIPKIAMPGDYLCVEEEFMPANGVYVDEGKVRASVIGIPAYDYISRRVSIKPFKGLKIPRSGDIVIGVAASVKEDVVIVKVLGFDIYNTFKNPFSGLLHISQVSETRIQSIYDAIKMGDLIKAKVLNNYIPLLLTTKEPKLGVILAYCSKCGSVLIKNGDKLVCPKCNNIETRKISMDYLATAKYGRR
ncbi:MAG TPA: S1 RNA-binding domain-containing protein [Ignisphaera sp.]|nr:S1 RNA-binding domain-containing protein [Ignisphaera sp.]